jgi:hypothetical protein
MNEIENKPKSAFLIAQSLVLALLCTLGKTSHAADEPNLIFIMVDDMGKDPVGCYGNGTRSATPELDGLAATGMRFTNAYSMPKCTPTRVALLTGQYPYRNGWVNHYDVPRWNLKGFNPKKNPCIANVMKSAGYATCIAGKWQLNDFRDGPKILNDCGFDEFCVWTGHEAGNPPSDMRYWSPYLHTAAGSKTYSDGFGPEVFNDFILDFIRKHKDEPMFIYYPMVLKHNGAGWREWEGSSMVAAIDKLTGRVVKVLDEVGIRKNTILIWTTDNGRNKGSISESGCCVPFIVNCPGTVPQGVVTDALIDITDIMPTFAELGAATLPEGYTFDGRSFANLITGEVNDGPREWILAMGGGVCGRGMGDIGRSRGKRKKKRRLGEDKGTGAGPGKPETTSDEQNTSTGAKEGDSADPSANPPPVEGRNKSSFRDRVIRDKFFKIYIGADRNVRSFIHMNRDGSEGDAADRQKDPKARAAFDKFMKIIAEFPDTDANPRY